MLFPMTIDESAKIGVAVLFLAAGMSRLQERIRAVVSRGETAQSAGLKT
jgi:hypothetical protein